MKSGAHCIAWHGMIDGARKAWKRARNVPINPDTQRFSGLRIWYEGDSYTGFRLGLSKHKASQHDPSLK